VLNRAAWSSREASRVLVELLVEAFVPEGPLVVGIDETLERRKGKKIAAKGVYRDPVRSSHSHFVKASGLRWVCVTLLAEIPWAKRIWALPFLSVLAYSERYAKEQGKRHKKITEWAWQLLVLIRRWYPKREIVAVADGAYASLKLLDRCRSLRKPITFITRLRLDAALYEPAPPRRPGQLGRPRLLKGERLANFSVVAEDPSTSWKATTTVANWYGARERVVEVVSEKALWYSTGLPAVPLRWVPIRDPRGEFETQALLCTGLGTEPERIISWFVRRWQMEATFKKYGSAWALRPKGTGPSARSCGLPQQCWDCSLWLRSSPTTKRGRSPTSCGEQPGTTNLIQPSQVLWRWCAKSCGPNKRRLFAGRRRRLTR
jgi:hypothetical protein